MRKTQLISLSSYCPEAKEWDVKDLIKRAVNREDTINHVYVHPKIPKLTYQSTLKESVGLWNFFSRTVESYLP